MDDQEVSRQGLTTCWVEQEREDISVGVESVRAARLDPLGTGSVDNFEPIVGEVGI